MRGGWGCTSTGVYILGKSFVVLAYTETWYCQRWKTCNVLIPGSQTGRRYRVQQLGFKKQPPPYSLNTNTPPPPPPHKYTHYIFAVRKSYPFIHCAVLVACIMIKITKSSDRSAFCKNYIVYQTYIVKSWGDIFHFKMKKSIKKIPKLYIFIINNLMSIMVFFANHVFYLHQYIFLIVYKTTNVNIGSGERSLTFMIRWLCLAT